MSRIGIIGGGIVGSAIANWLISEGHNVTVFEAKPGGRPASAGNAGLIALTEIEPLAQMSTLNSVPKWLVDPDGPLALRLADMPSLIPWLAAFALNARPDKVRRSRAALAWLIASVFADHEELTRRSKRPAYLRDIGSLGIYDNTASLDGAMREAKHVKELLGLEVHRLTATEARALVPQLEGAFAGATHIPSPRMVTDPLEVWQGYQDAARKSGTFVAATVCAIEPESDGASILTDTGERQSFDYAVLAAGVWSRDIVRHLGLKVLLETERGYNTTYADPDLRLPMSLYFTEHGFVASPLVNALRVGGAVELAQPDAPRSTTRAAAMRRKMRHYVPALPEEGGEEWMGCRPSTPDSLPVISRHPGNDRILFAFGHGHLGLTLSATTARHIAALIARTADETSLVPFSISRFQ